MSTSTKTHKTDDNGPQEQINKMEEQKAESQNVVLDGKDAQEAVDNAHAQAYAAPTSTTMKIGDRDKGPRTYAEAEEAGRVEKPENVVVNPSTYEAAVRAVEEK